MRIRPTLTVALLLAAILPVALPTAVTAVVGIHLLAHHSPGHDHAAHHRADHDHRHRMDAAAEPDRPATLPSSPNLPTVTAASLPGLTLPDTANLDPVTTAPWTERRGPPPLLLHLHGSLLL